MSWIDRILRKRKVYTGNTPVVSEQQAAEDPLPKQARVVVPDVEENETFVNDLIAHQEGRSCGYCIHFNLKAGQARIHDLGDMILPRLLEQFKLQSIGGHLNPNEIGLCEQWSSSQAEPALMHASSPPTVSTWWLDSQCPWGERDKQKQCTYFRARPKGWRRLFSKGELG